MNNDGVDNLEYSPEGLASRALLFNGVNDINLYVEDTAKEYEYETIFKRMLGKNYHIETVLALGGKEGVKNHFQEYGEETDGVKNYYIVDGDFDRYIHPETMVNSHCFIYLESYNIENYFLDEKACLDFAKGKLQCLDDEVKRRVAFSNWREKIVEQAKKLFLCYCFVQKYYPAKENVSRKEYLFIDKETGFEKTDGAFEEYWNELLALDADIEAKIGDISRSYEVINGNDYYNLICGKFLFISFCCYLRTIIKDKAFKNDDLRWHLVSNFDISKLNYVRDAIIGV